MLTSEGTPPPMQEGGGGDCSVLEFGHLQISWVGYSWNSAILYGFIGFPFFEGNSGSAPLSFRNNPYSYE